MLITAYKRKTCRLIQTFSGKLKRKRGGIIMRNCENCRRKCESRGIAFKNMTIRCSELCPLEIQAECKVIATPEFRKVVEQLRQNPEGFGVKGILTQAECILNAADNILA